MDRNLFANKRAKENVFLKIREMIISFNKNEFKKLNNLLKI